MLSAALSGTVNWSLGCHAGYSVPDQDVVTDSISSPDFPQALAQKGATWIANTGYGYGTDAGIAASERLMLLFTQALGDADKVPVGEALRLAKLRYLQSLPAGGLTPYDAKSLMVSTLYGLPMYQIDTPVSRGPLSSALDANLHSEEELQGLTIVTYTQYLSPELQKYESENGDYYAVAVVTRSMLKGPWAARFCLFRLTRYLRYYPYPALTTRRVTSHCDPYLDT